MSQPNIILIFSVIAVLFLKFTFKIITENHVFSFEDA